MSDEDRIADVLGIRKLSEVLEEDKGGSEVVTIECEENLPEVVPGDSLSEELVDDIDAAKNNMAKIIEIGMDSLKELTDIAKQSEAPRAFEVAATLMESLLNANKEMIAMSEKKKFAKEDAGSTANKTTNVTNNNLILSTADLLKMMKGE